MMTLKKIFTKVTQDFEAILVEMDGEEDHVHVLCIDQLSS